MIIGMPSVRHTGTRTVRESFFGFKKMHPEDKPTAYCIYSRHIEDRYEHEADREILVIPLRRLDRIIVSWERREKDLSELREHLWRLIEKYDHRDPFYVPVDSPNRDLYWQQINDELGLCIIPEWQVITEKDSVYADFNDVQDKETAASMIDEFSFFFERFYGAAGHTGVKQAAS